MGNASFNQDWYGMQAKVLAQSDDRVVVDYGCKGRGIVKNYNLFEGIQLCFLDFESDESMETQKFNPDIIQITHCPAGMNVNLLTTLYRICQRAILALRQQSICRFPFLSLWENITASASSLTVRRFQMEHAG